MELRATYDAATLGAAPRACKAQGVIHWVSVQDALDVEVRLYDRLFNCENPDAAEGDYRDYINPDSLVVKTGCKAEPTMADAAPEERFQFEREGYFCVDRKNSTPDKPVFNLTVTLRDTWAKKSN